MDRRRLAAPTPQFEEEKWPCARYGEQGELGRLMTWVVWTVVRVCARAVVRVAVRVCDRAVVRIPVRVYDRVVVRGAVRIYDRVVVRRGAVNRTAVLHYVRNRSAALVGCQSGI